MSRQLSTRSHAVRLMICAVALGLAGVGCADNDDSGADGQSTASVATNELGFPPDGVFTKWQAATGEFNLLPDTVGQSSTALTDRYAVELMELLEFTETDSETADEDDTSIGVIGARGAPDDALLGIDVRLSMRRGEAGAWTIESIETRALCARGEPIDNLCP